MLTPGFGAYPKTISNHPTLLNNLISYWELEESSGTRFDSVLSSGNDLTDNNTVGQTDGVVRKGASFIRANAEYLSIADNASLSVGDIDFTITLWAYLSAKGTSQWLIGKARSSGTGRNGGWNLLYITGTDRFEFTTFQSSGAVCGRQRASTFGSPSTSTWYYIICQHDASSNTTEISVDNGIFDVDADTGTVGDGSHAFQIAKQEDSTLYLGGRVDEVGFWKRLLTSEEIDYLYNNGNGRSFK